MQRRPLAQPEILCLTNGAFAENCYLVVDRGAQDVVIVDPGEEPDLFLRRIDTEKLNLTAIWLTHAHLDHIAGVAHVVRETGVDVYLHEDDRQLYDSVVEQAAWLGVKVEEQPPPRERLVPGQTVTVGGFAFRVVHVPGHSPGSVAFIGYGVTLSGDVLFDGSVGRVDLPGGDGAMLLQSIQDHLLSLPDETIVYPGHGPATTIGRERTSNPFLTGAYPLA